MAGKPCFGSIPERSQEEKNAKIYGGMSGDFLLYAFESIFQNDLVNNLSADNAAPSKEMLTISVEFLIDHYSITSMTPHDTLLLVGMNLQTDFKPRPAAPTTPFLQHSVCTGFHNAQFYPKRRKSK